MDGRSIGLCLFVGTGASVDIHGPALGLQAGSNHLYLGVYRIIAVFDARRSWCA